MSFRTLAALLIAVPVIALAQPPGFDGENAAAHLEHKMEKLTEHLSLDQDQVVDVRAVIEASQAETHDARERMKASLETLHEAMEADDERALKKALQAVEDSRDDMHAVHQATQDELKSLLTLKQQAQLVELEVKKHQREREMKERAREHREERGERREFRHRNPAADL